MYHAYCDQLQNSEEGANMASKGGSKGGQESEDELKTLYQKLKEGRDKGATHSLLSKYLTDEVYNKIKDRKTTLGGTLGDCIKSGCENMGSHCGLYACDPEAYDVFQELFDPLIKDYHATKTDHPKPNFGTDDQIKELGDLDPSGEMIISTRVRVGRSHVNNAFCPKVTVEEQKAMETKTAGALSNLKEELEGKYYPLEGMKKEDEKQLVEDHFLFKDDDAMLGSAGGYRNWPKGRGIYHNKGKTFLVWLNEEDHLRFISMQKGGNLSEVYKRLVDAMSKLEDSGLNFARHGKYGFLTFCPTNLGTAMRASVHIKIPKLASKKGEIEKICDKYKLQPRGIHGENTESVGGVYDISNKRRMGLTEYDAILEMKNGIVELMKAEKAL